MIKNTLVAGLVAVIVSVGLFLAFPKQVVQQFGANAGPDHYNLQRFFGGVVNGSPVLSIGASATATTLTANQVCGNSTVQQTPAGNATFTLPTSVALVSTCLPNIGNSVTIAFKNASSAGTFAVATSTGMTLYHTSSTTAFTVASATPLFVTIKTTGTSTADAFFERYIRP